MSTLQELLTQSVTQTMGLSDILNKRRAEATQLGQALTEQAGYQASGILNSANITANATNKITAMGGDPMSDPFSAGLAIKKGWDTEAKRQEEKAQTSTSQMLTALNAGLLKEGTVDIGGTKYLMRKRYEPEAIKLNNGGVVIFDKDNMTFKTPNGDSLNPSFVDNSLSANDKANLENKLRNQTMDDLKTGLQISQYWKNIMDYTDPNQKDLVVRLDDGKVFRGKDMQNIRDIGLIYGFVKMNDPTSVVMTSETKLATSTASALDRLGISVNQIMNGQPLSDVQRQGILSAANTAFLNVAPNIRSSISKTRASVKQYGLNEDTVLGTNEREMEKNLARLEDLYKKAPAESNSSGGGNPPADTGKAVGTVITKKNQKKYKKIKAGSDNDPANWQEVQ